MIKIEAKSHDGTFYIKMQGHANFNPGNDIVCAAASMLIQTLNASLLIGIGGGVLRRSEMDKGSALVEFKNGQTLYDVTLLGFKLLEKAYPENVCVIIL